MFELMPFGRQERNLFRYLDNMEKSFFGDMGESIAQFRTDILDKGDHYLLEAELPGFTKEDIKIDLENGYLNIHAEHKEEKEEKEKNYVRRERKYGSFSRAFDLTGIKSDAITAKYENGILQLELPKEKPEPKKEPRQIDIR